MEKDFKSRLAHIMRTGRGSKKILTKKRYDYLLKKVISAKENESGRNPDEIEFLRRFDVVKIGNTEKLIFPGEQDPSKWMYYAHVDELYSIINEMHLMTNHGSKHKLMKELGKKYMNITQEEVLIYLELCEVCQENEGAFDKDLIKKARMRKFTSMKTLRKEGWHRSHFDIVDMRSHPDGDYKYIMVHKEHRTKFMILKPMKTRTSTEAASLLLESFALFGPPDIMHFNNGRKFGRRVLEKVGLQWEDANIILGKATCSRILGKTVRARCGIDKMVYDWMEKYNVNQWAMCLCFVQILNNVTYRKSIKSTPYEAMFGRPIPSDTEIIPGFGISYDDLYRKGNEEIDVDDEYESESDNLE